VEQAKIIPNEEVKVLLKMSAYGNPVPNRKVQIDFRHEAGITGQILGETNRDGVFETTVASGKPGKIEISGYDVHEVEAYKILDEELIEISDEKGYQGPKDSVKVYLKSESSPGNVFTSILNWISGFFRSWS
jgi:hypothetical protein